MSSKKRKQVPTTSTDHCTSFEDLLQRVDECIRRQSATVSALLLPSFEGVDVLAAVVCKFVFSNPFTDPIPCWIPHFEEVGTLEASAEQLEGTRVDGMPLNCDYGNLHILECQISGSDLPREWLRFHSFGDLRAEMVYDPIVFETHSFAAELESESAPTRAKLKRLCKLYTESGEYDGDFEDTQVLERWEKQWDLPRCVGALNLHLGLRFESKALAIAEDTYGNSAYDKFDILRNAAALDCNKGKTFADKTGEQLGGFIRGEKRRNYFFECNECGSEVRAELLFIRVIYDNYGYDYPYNLVYCPSHAKQSIRHTVVD